MIEYFNMTSGQHPQNRVLFCCVFCFSRTCFFGALFPHNDFCRGGDFRRFFELTHHVSFKWDGSNHHPKLFQQTFGTQPKQTLPTCYKPGFVSQLPRIACFFEMVNLQVLYPYQSHCIIKEPKNPIETLRKLTSKQLYISNETQIVVFVQGFVDAQEFHLFEDDARVCMPTCLW